MKIVKAAVAISAVLAVAGTCVFAAQYKATINGTSYGSDGTKITATKFNNKDLIGANKGAAVILDDSAGAILTVDKTGVVLATNVVFGGDTCTSNAVKGSLKEKVCAIGFIGKAPVVSEGEMIVDQKTTITTKGTNVTAKGSGFFIDNSGNPGVVSLSVSGAFKPKTK